jgi:hypothetical protein
LPIPDDVDPDLLISRLAGPLAPDMRQAFRRAAEDALARVPCQGEGAIYRAVAPLQRAFFDPPDDRRAAWDIEQEPRVNKLTAAPAIEHGRDLRFTVQAGGLGVAFWAVSRLAPRHEALALAGYEVYLPRLRERRVIRRRKVEVTPPLFPGYCFTLIELQWHAARWAPGRSG